MTASVDKAEVLRAGVAGGFKSATLPFAMAYGAGRAVLLRLMRWGYYLCLGSAVLSGVLQLFLLLVRPGWHQLGVVAGNVVALAALGAIGGCAASLKRQLSPAGSITVAKVGPVADRGGVVDVPVREVRSE